MNDCEVTQQDLHDLLGTFERKSFEAGQCEEGSLEYNITKKCECLYKLDYSLIEIDNANGILSPRYPGRLFIPEYENNRTTATSYTNGCNGTTVPPTPIPSSANSIHAYVTFANPLEVTNAQTANQTPFQSSQPQQQTQQQHTIYEDLYDVPKIRDLISFAKYARCRQRFAVPVIMYRGKYICRSATISVMPETYGRKVVDYAYDCLNGTNSTERSTIDDENNDPTDESLLNHINEPSPFSYDEVIKSDIQLLNALNVATILDLMVEKRKIKYFMAVSSSEKADPENHYENFNILSLPYPGCEFFKKFRDNNYMAKGLYYNWKQSFNDAVISIPKLGPAADLDICWHDYKKWDLIIITQNYLKVALKYIQEESTGLLIHCISGWDRTPLFISLVRLSLWADGLIHQSLNALQMAFFTLAYDWYLFGHQLPDRLKRGEDIMFFCFHVLKYIHDDEFSIVENRKRTKTSSSGSSNSVIVIKADCCDDEPLKEDYILSFDHDSNDSFSNSSNCDMSDNYCAAPTATTAATTSTTTITTAPLLPNITSRSPNLKRSKTNPISVPGANALSQRQESASSNGSWQVVTETGSIDSMMNGSYMMRFVTQQQDTNNLTDNSIPTGINCYTTTFSNGSNGCYAHATNSLYINKDDSLPTNTTSSTKTHTTSLRQQRLNSVRAIFIQAYGKTVGLKFKEGSAMNLTTFIGTLADQIF